MLKQLSKLLVLAVALFLATSCAVDDGEPDDEPVTEPEPPPEEGILLTDWVEAMIADESAPDTVNDKPAIVINVEDPDAFDGYFPPRN